jgi:hypothetical protein
MLSKCQVARSLVGVGDKLLWVAQVALCVAGFKQQVQQRQVQQQRHCKVIWLWA